MELINNKYIKINRNDIFLGQAKALNANNKVILKYYENLTKVLIDYEKETKEFVKEIYISKESKYICHFLLDFNISINRQSVLNALIFATLSNEVDITRKLSEIILNRDKDFEKSEKLLNYILNHSMDINEYIDGESERLIYNDVNNKFEKRLIYENNNLKLTKKYNSK